ncbi:hypothetical protein B0H12DRAFT_1145018 [Mycena haematopus]|nr:hypothetical protein B0H12DRAFT_1156423 [Mycena haematopus]KAJ7232642.1 hypothetical protein B0H12DRAFT_1145018 [Mycena haematopus]
MNNDSTPTPLSIPTASLLTISTPIPASIPRPIYGVPQYNYHGLPFSLLPPDIQSFLSSHGLDNVAAYDPVAVTCVRLWLTDQLMDTVNGVCQAIVHVNMRYNLLRTVYPVSHLFLTALVDVFRGELLPKLEQHMTDHLAHADALVWVDVAAREGGPEALTVGEALHYRSLQIQPAIDLVATYIVELYEWSAAMWMQGWRSDGFTTYLQAQPPVSEEEVTEQETAQPALGTLSPSIASPQPSVSEEEAAPPATFRLDTPPPSITSSPAHSPPVRPSTPSSEPRTPDSSPRSARRVAVSPPASPVRAARGVAQSASWIKKSAYPQLGMGCALPHRAR